MNALISSGSFTGNNNNDNICSDSIVIVAASTTIATSDASSSFFRPNYATKFKLFNNNPNNNNNVLVYTLGDIVSGIAEITFPSVLHPLANVRLSFHCLAEVKWTGVEDVLNFDSCYDQRNYFDLISKLDASGLYWFIIIVNCMIYFEFIIDDLRERERERVKKTLI